MIQRRIHNFLESTIPLLEHYDYAQRLLTIDGEQSLGRVEQEIVSSLI